MLYETIREGFMTRGLHRGQGVYAEFAAVREIRESLFYAPDTLKNKEIGWKTSWSDQHVQLNEALPRRWYNVAEGNIRPRFVRQPDLHRLTGPRTTGSAGVEGDLIVIAKEHLRSCSSLEQQSQQNRCHPGGNSGVPVSGLDGREMAVKIAHRRHSKGNIRIRKTLPFGPYAGYWQVAAQPLPILRIGFSHPGRLRVAAAGLSTDGHTTFMTPPSWSKKGAWGVDLVGEEHHRHAGQRHVNGLRLSRS